MNSLELLEIANRAIATGGIAPPSEVLEMAKMTAFMCRVYNQIQPLGIDLHFVDPISKGLPYKASPVSNDTVSPNTRDYND